MSARTIAACGFALLLIAAGASIADEPPRPNFLWITCEDMSPNLGCYGDPYAVTPNLDALASRGVRYTRAFAATGVCATSRSSLIMGMYASTIGTQHMRGDATLPAALPPFPVYLRQAGYFCINSGKEDYNFTTPRNTWDASRGNAHWRQRRDPAQPFFAVININITHESRIRGPESFVADLPAERRHDPAKANLPPYLPDTPGVRTEWARYADLVTLMDAQAGKILAQLRADGLADDTIVFFFSDHGVGFPRAKQFVYDSGMQTPLIVHVPEKFKHLAPSQAGGTSERLVSFVDFAPTLLALAGVAVPPHMQGRSFLGHTAEPRDHVFGLRDRMDERYDLTRTVRDARFKYHRNYMPFVPHYPRLEYMDMLETAREYRRLAAEGKLTGGQAFFMAATKPLEELYDLDADPFEMNNLAADPSYGEHLQRLRALHLQWVKRTRDTGFVPEAELRARAADPAFGSEHAFGQSDAYELDRIVQTAWLMDRGVAARDELIERLGDGDPIVRYWAALGLVNLGAEAAPAIEALKAPLTDASPDVRIAAAYAIAVAGDPAAALPVLEDYIGSQNPHIALHAGNVVDALDTKAAPLAGRVDEIARSLRGKGGSFNRKYAMLYRWLLEETLRGIE